MTSEEGQAGGENQVVLAQYKYSKRVLLKTIVGREDGGLGLIGERVVVGGWVKSSKEVKKEVESSSSPPPPPSAPSTSMKGQKEVTCVELIQSRIPFFRAFLKVLNSSNSPGSGKLESIPAKPIPSIAYLQISDGSCIPSLQIVLDSSRDTLIRFTPTGTSLLVEGTLKKASIPGKRDIELVVEKIMHVGAVDSDRYPLSKTRLSLDVLRGYSHFRPRTNTVASVTRIRNALTHGTHTFLQTHGFLHVHMPVITSTDSKGLSEKFQVTTIFRKEDKIEKSKVAKDNINLDVVKAAIKEKNDRIEELKRTESNRESLALAVQDLKKANELASQLEAREKTQKGNLPVTGNLDFSKDFFQSPMYLTVSSQLHLETYASSLGSVYTTGPAFSAEKSHSTKHLAETWMVEVALAFADLEDVMNCAEDYLKFICQWVLAKCAEDLKFASKRIDKTLNDNLQSVISSSFAKITYRDAVQLLRKVTDKKFETGVEWGVALTEEHESFLADEIYKSPVIIYNYPKELKPFFMRLNDDGKTVASIDVVIPKAGTLIRGSQKEERINFINKRIKELNLPKRQYEWYLDLRRHGTVKSSGFSLGFDQLVLFSTGLTDIRDIIPFPRSYGYANY